MRVVPGSILISANVSGRLRKRLSTNRSCDVKDTELYPSGKARIFAQIAAYLPFLLFYEQSNYPGLPGLIYAWADAIERRDETLFKALAQWDTDFVSGSQGMYDAIFCLDGYRDPHWDPFELRLGLEVDQANIQRSMAVD